jgi:hypothetical protein
MDRVTQVSPVDSDIKLEYLDLPRLHCFGDSAGDSFFDALANTEDLTLFTRKSIIALIDYKWPLVRDFTIKRLFIPFILFQITFFTFSNFIYVAKLEENLTPENEETWTATLEIIFSVLLILFSAYFMYYEVRQMVL